MEEAYVMKDPFTEERGFITLGSSCSICKSLVCLSQVLQYCSLYFTSASFNFPKASVLLLESYSPRFYTKNIIS